MFVNISMLGVPRKNTTAWRIRRWRGTKRSARWMNMERIFVELWWDGDGEVGEMGFGVRCRGVCEIAKMHLSSKIVIAGEVK